MVWIKELIRKLTPCNHDFKLTDEYTAWREGLIYPVGVKRVFICAKCAKVKVHKDYD